ncbi:MAG: hypothetical protein KBS97_01980 [Firmicutes bacterium]|nr:hypothetical protein [Candidatus Fiminaster equi]
MVIIAAIGAFFKKIWDWIRQTAWIQPLLIVGIIFGVIFSIKPIVDAAKASSEKRKAASTFYYNYQKSLADGEKSKADELTYILEDVMNKPAGSVDISKVTNKDGQQMYKFFLMYVAETCENCEAAKDGFDVLSSEMGSDIFKANDGLPFNLVTIFADELTSESETNKTAFVKYLERHQTFFEDAGGIAYETAYYTNKPLSDTDLEYLETSDPDNFLTPTILLIELDQPGKENKHGYDGLFNAGVTEVMFGVEGETAHDKAQTLLDCWNHEGKFCFNDKK